MVGRSITVTRHSFSLILCSRDRQGCQQMVNKRSGWLCIFRNQLTMTWGTWLSWSYGSWIYNFLCNQCLSSLKLWVRIPPRRSVLDTTLCDEVYQWLTTGRWFPPGSPVSSTNKTDCHDMTGILLKVALNTITTTLATGMILLWKFSPLFFSY
jgi:hypothetical protein